MAINTAAATIIRITGLVEGNEPPRRWKTVRKSPQAIRIMLPSKAAAQARCMGAATGASQSMTASTVVDSLRGAGGAGCRNSSEGCASLGAPGRRVTRVEVRVTVLGFGCAGGSKTPSNGITLLEGRSWKSMAWRGPENGCAGRETTGARGGSLRAGCGTAAKAPAVAVAYTSFCGRAAPRGRGGSQQLRAAR